MERPEVSVLLAVKQDFEILCANNMSQECEGTLQLNTSCLYEILITSLHDLLTIGLFSICLLL